jgi:polyphosphate kinase 2 (PPK2 family)
VAKKGRAPTTTSELKPSGADASNGADASSGAGGSAGAEASQRQRFHNKAYLLELAGLQLELVKLQEWIRQQGLRVVVVFEGRDAAGKGGVIKTITQSLNPRVCRVVALAAPTERE